MHAHGLLPFNSLEYDPFIISDAMLGPPPNGNFSLPHHADAFPMPPLQAPQSLHDPDLGMNSFAALASTMGMGTSSASHDAGLLQPHLDLAVPSSDRQPLPTRSFSRSLPEMGGPSRASIQDPSSASQPSAHSSKTQHSLSNKEVVREQNRRAAARFRQRQKVGIILDCSSHRPCPGRWWHGACGLARHVCILIIALTCMCPPALSPGQVAGV